MRQWLIILVGPILATIAAWLGFALCSAISEAERLQVDGKFAKLRVALETYHDRYSSFPPITFQAKPGGPTHSWRVLLLPLLNQESAYLRYDFEMEWNSELNLAAIEHVGVFDSYSTGDDNQLGNFLAVDIEGHWPTNTPLKSALIRYGKDRFMLVELKHTSDHWAKPVEALSNQKQNRDGG